MKAISFRSFAILEISVSEVSQTPGVKVGFLSGIPSGKSGFSSSGKTGKGAGAYSVESLKFENGVSPFFGGLQAVKLAESKSVESKRESFCIVTVS